MSKKYNRSSRAPESELKVTCPIEGCGRRFINKQGISVHLWKTHGISQKKSYVLSPGQTICDNCKVDFGSEKSLHAHGGPEVCKARKDKNYLKFNCGTCGKVSERYIHPSRRGGEVYYCSSKCQRSRKWSPKLSKASCGQEFYSPYNIELEWNSDEEYSYEHKCLMCSKKFVAANRGLSEGGNICSKCYSRSIRVTGDNEVCRVCYKSFVRKNMETICSKECRAIAQSGYKIKDTSRMGGPRPGGGHSKLLEFADKQGRVHKLNREEIVVAQYLDSTQYKWERNHSIGIPYIDRKGNERKFYPDFYIEELDLFIEYKGWLADSMRHKMHDAQLRNMNKNILVIVGEDKRFLKDGISITKFINNEVNLEEYKSHKYMKYNL